MATPFTRFTSQEDVRPLCDFEDPVPCWRATQSSNTQSHQRLANPLNKTRHSKRPQFFNVKVEKILSGHDIYLPIRSRAQLLEMYIKCCKLDMIVQRLCEVGSRVEVYRI